MHDVVEVIRRRKIIAAMDGDDRQLLVSGAVAAATGGVQLLALPVILPDVADVVAELSDMPFVRLGLSGVVTQDHLSLALAMDAQFILCPATDRTLLATAADRGLLAIPGAATPTEVAQLVATDQPVVQVYPVFDLGGPGYFRRLSRHFPQTLLVAAGGIDVDSGPNYLEAGASAIVISQGLLPDTREPDAANIITTRAAALVEVCGEIAPHRR
jgi:2-dehydro-3-deoxyphosphogluconate aldolase/(4S)-4-hydroxy-2-oxoglutarate aldolase